MATDEQKKENTMQLVGITVTSLALGIWDMVGDGAYALCPAMGDQMLHLMEHRMGLEIAGENPQDVMTEIARLLVDEFGLAQRVDLDHAEEMDTMTARTCAGAPLCGAFVQNGVEPFTCIVRNVGFAALTRAGLRVRPQITYNQPEGCVVAFRKR